MNHRKITFVLHDGIEEYFVRITDSETEEIVKENSIGNTFRRFL